MRFSSRLSLIALIFLGSTGTAKPPPASGPAWAPGTEVQALIDGQWWNASVASQTGAKVVVRLEADGRRNTLAAAMLRIRPQPIPNATACKPCQSRAGTRACPCPMYLDGILLPADAIVMATESKPGFHGGSQRFHWVHSARSAHVLAKKLAADLGLTAQSATQFYGASGATVTLLPSRPAPQRKLSRAPVAKTPPTTGTYMLIQASSAPPPCPRCPAGTRRSSSSVCRCDPVPKP